MSFKWYVIQTYSGSENSVINNVKQRVAKYNFQDNLEEIIVPTKKIVQVKKGKKIEVEKNVYPGYILAKMDLNDNLWYIIKNIPKVSGFISQGGKPKALSQAEIDDILNKINENSFSDDVEVSFDIGESVRVVDGGPFDGFTGDIDSIDYDKKEMVVSVAILGRPTPVVINFDQVEKI